MCLDADGSQLDDHVPAVSQVERSAGRGRLGGCGDWLSPARGGAAHRDTGQGKQAAFIPDGNSASHDRTGDNYTVSAANPQVAFVGYR